MAHLPPTAVARDLRCFADSKNHDNGRLCHAETPQQHQNPGSSRPPTLKIKLRARGTEQAVVTLAELSNDYPERLVIASNLLRARSSVFASAWSPPRPEELAALFQDARRRLVRSEAELADLILEVLAAINRDLPGHAELLWDRLPKRVLPSDSTLGEAWLPKPEATLSAYLAHELSNHLEGRGLAVNREVLVRPTDAYGAGDRTDILVEATMRHDLFHGSVPGRLAVVIEVKGSWNPHLMIEQRRN